MHKPVFLIVLCFSPLLAQDKEREQEIERGSRIAKGGFRNEDDIRNKFSAWRTDKDAQAWLMAMNYKLSDIKSLKTRKPHGHKSDVGLPEFRRRRATRFRASRSSLSVAQTASTKSTSAG